MSAGSRAPVPVGTNPERRSSATTFVNAALAAAILLAPMAFTVGGLLDPVVHVTNGAANIAAFATANPVTNALHLGAFVLASFLLPISVVGMARLALQGSPWLAVSGAALGLIGWLPFSALAAQEDLTLQMARLGGGDLLAALWEQFNDDPIMTFYLVVYIAGHLAAYVVLAIALRRARVIPAWAAWTLAASTPLTLAFFATRQRNELVGVVMELLFCATFIIGSVPVARASLKHVPCEPEKARTQMASGVAEANKE